MSLLYWPIIFSSLLIAHYIKIVAKSWHKRAWSLIFSYKPMRDIKVEKVKKLERSIEFLSNKLLHITWLVIIWWNSANYCTRFKYLICLIYFIGQDTKIIPWIYVNATIPLLHYLLLTTQTLAYIIVAWAKISLYFRIKMYFLCFT